MDHSQAARGHEGGKMSLVSQLGIEVVKVEGSPAIRKKTVVIASSGVGSAWGGHGRVLVVFSFES